MCKNPFFCYPKVIFPLEDTSSSFWFAWDPDALDHVFYPEKKILNLVETAEITPHDGELTVHCRETNVFKGYVK